MKSSKLKPLFLLTASLALTACSSTPAPAPVKAVQPELKAKVEAQPEPDVEVAPLTQSLSASEFLQQAEQSQGTEQQQELLQAARANLQQGQVDQALAIHQVLQQQADSSIMQQNLLPWFEALLAKGQHQDIQQFIQQFPLNQFHVADQQLYLQKQAQYWTERQEPKKAVAAYLQLLQLVPTDQSSQLALWQQLGLLTPQQLQQLTQDKEKAAQGWASLLQIHQRLLGDLPALQAELQNWQSSFSNLPALAQLPAEIQQLSQVQGYNPQTIAVLLPFNSNFRQHAEAIQQGLLAASVNHPARLLFLDSTSSPADLKLQMQQQQVEFVIGPLLKEQVDSLANDPDWTWPTLFLNSRTEQIAPSEQKYYFALSVEDEAHQMAQWFQHKGYKQPVLMASRNPLSQRMVNQFSRDWQQITGKAPETYWVTDMASMESTIKQLLETAASEQRIQEIERLSGQDVRAETHSRQDIDAIYLLADPAQTRMLKPFIDVSVAPAAISLPIYASSRSHQKSAELTDRRDLLNLTFTEMPWMLSQQQQQALREQYNTLFPQQDETLQRLFAMGFDAFQLVFKLKQQQQFPALPHRGLTGDLRLAADGQIQRQLTLGKYSKTSLQSLDQP
ncbi:penicillin-binding protein activator [Rheinheimera sp.]|uniref:penicillin-binding protein activator n=1 Tax=Rheinheimera sp. TaxID=1869214 RepID=UPI00307D701B